MRVARRISIGFCLILLFGAPALAQLEDRDGDGTIECCERGDVLCGVGSGQIEQRHPVTGALIRTLNNGTGSTEQTGMCFDAVGDMFSTNFSDGSMSKFDMSSDPTVPGSTCGMPLGPFGGGFSSRPESCVVTAGGDVLSGEVDGAQFIRRFNAAGVLQDTYAPTTGPRGVDWLDLDADQCTVLYASEGDVIRRFDICTDTQLSDFATAADGLVAPCFGLRIRPGTTAGALASGEVIVSCFSTSVRLDGDGNFIQAYPGGALAPPSGSLFAMNLDPDGSTFWTADIGNGNVYRIDIASGAQVNTFQCPPLASTAGLAVCGEPLASTVCGNDINEADEDCDGTDDGACPGQCRDDCTCPSPGEVGACCTDGPLLESDCIEVTLADCDLAGPDGGLFLGPGTSCDDVEDCVPLAVTMDSMSVKTTPEGLSVMWTTALEIDTYGFRILRETEGAREKTAQVISPIIPSVGGGLVGASYEFIDTSITSRSVVRYWIEEIDTKGKFTRHGPVVVGGHNPLDDRRRNTSDAIPN